MARFHGKIDSRACSARMFLFFFSFFIVNGRQEEFFQISIEEGSPQIQFKDLGIVLNFRNLRKLNIRTNAG